MLSCKEATTAMAQELKQAVYVKPNLTAEMANRFKGTWNLFTQYIVDLQQDTAHNLEW